MQGVCPGCRHELHSCICGPVERPLGPPLQLPPGFTSLEQYSAWYYNVYMPSQAPPQGPHAYGPFPAQQHPGPSSIPFPSSGPGTSAQLNDITNAGTNTSSRQKRPRQTATSASSTATANPHAPKRTRVNAGAGRPRTTHSQPAGADTPSQSHPSANESGGPAVPGVGPITEDEHSIPRAFSSGTHFESIARKPKANIRADAATDVWYFVRGLTSPDPVSLPEAEPCSKTYPSRKEFSHLGCKLCKDWTTWANVDGQSKTIRKHMEKEHGDLWRTSVWNLKLKGWQTVLRPEDIAQDPPSEQEKFSIKGFYKRLIRWIAVDDQSLDVVDSPELRDLLLFLGQEHITKKDLPHRTKLTDMIFEAFEKEYKAIIDRIQNAMGRVSFTSDIWSRKNLQSYMAITAHYIMCDASGRLVLRTDLVAFRGLDESHTGVNLAKVFLDVMKEIGTLNKIGLITLDNASNNNTMMDDMAKELGKLDIPFSVEGNRIRCFPHVVNIAVKHGLKHCTVLPWNDPDLPLENYNDEIVKSIELVNDTIYCAALESDTVASARKVVEKLRASDGRRKELRATIVEGNLSGGWGNPPVAIDLLQLLKDVDTRWSSTFLMIDRVIELDLPVQRMMANSDDLAMYALSEMELTVLRDIREFLSYAHQVQELVSAEQTPTLSIVIPLYEELLTKLRRLTKEIPKLRHAIEASINKLEEYLAYSRKAKIYNLAIVLNPTMKFKWIRDNWSFGDYSAARTQVREAMLKFRRSDRAARMASAPTTPVRRTVSVSSIPSASRKQKSGLARFRAMGQRQSNPNVMAQTPPLPDSPAVQQQLEMDDKNAVDHELAKYEEEGILGEAPPNATEEEEEAAAIALEDFDIVAHWGERRAKLPLLFRLAMDVLPAQASAVPCERVFSSSKETDGLRRAAISPILMEVLQILKFSFRADRLSFFGDLVCTSEELEVINIPPSTIEHLISHGQINDLWKLINSAV